MTKFGNKLISVLLSLQLVNV